MKIFYKYFVENDIVNIVVAGMEDVKISFEKPTEPYLLEHMDGVIFSAIESTLNELRTQRYEFNLIQESDEYKKYFNVPLTLAAKIHLYH